MGHKLDVFNWSNSKAFFLQHSGILFIISTTVGGIALAPHIKTNPIGLLFFTLTILWLIFCGTDFRIAVPDLIKQIYIGLVMMHTTAPGLFCFFNSILWLTFAVIGQLLSGCAATQCIIVICSLCYISAYLKGTSLIITKGQGATILSHHSKDQLNAHIMSLSTSETLLNDNQEYIIEEPNVTLLFSADEIPSLEDISAATSPESSVRTDGSLNDLEGLDNWSLNSNDEQKSFGDIAEIDDTYLGTSSKGFDVVTPKRCNSDSYLQKQFRRVLTNTTEVVVNNNAIRSDHFECSSDSSDDEFSRGLRFECHSIVDATSIPSVQAIQNRQTSIHQKTHFLSKLLNNYMNWSNLKNVENRQNRQNKQSEENKAEDCAMFLRGSSDESDFEIVGNEGPNE